MNETEFWNLIDESRAKSTSLDEMMADLLGKVKLLSIEEIFDFESRFYEVFDRAYRWDVWGAGYVIKGGCSSDAFDYFRAWLIAQGRKNFEDVLKDPEILSEFDIDGDAECELLLSIAYDAYKASTGKNDFFERYAASRTEAVSAGSGEPKGTPWDESDLPMLFPKLRKRFGPKPN